MEPVANIKGLLKKFVELPRNVRQFLLLSIDILFLPLSLWLAVFFRYGSFQDFVFGWQELAVCGVTMLVSSVIFLRLGLYRAIIRFMGQQAIIAIVKAVTLSSLVLSLSILLFATHQIPRSAPFIYWCIALILIGGSRLSIRSYYQYKLAKMSENVVIYGAGVLGRQLIQSLMHGDQYQPIAFVDDDPNLHRSVIHGVPVISRSELDQLVYREEVTQILLAMPSVSRKRRREIISSLESLPVYVRTVPDVARLVAGKAEVAEIEDIAIEDLLGRESVPPFPELLSQCIQGKTVLVTGAGGSIGAELCRQIVDVNPRELILLDVSEFNLYEIHRELTEKVESLGNRVQLVPLLASVKDEARIRKVFETFDIQTVYHAAAYKHVPLVEYNVVEGVENNVFGTWNVALAARDYKVDAFVLVSTDKAVRPTNIMGASKRFSELLLQGLAEQPGATRYCMVRFGNVLGSSGSVVPLFREQIRQGGPVTVTHPDIYRYFMTISEAAQLVLQAGAMGQGGDVFVLDMGEPVRILDLAKRMIRLMGYDICDAQNPNGDIAIEFTGLRPGEKLNEELLSGDCVTGTGHPMILRAEEPSLSLPVLEKCLEQLRFECAHYDCVAIRDILSEAVKGFTRRRDVSDQVWSKQKENRKAFKRSAAVTTLPVNKQD